VSKHFTCAAILLLAAEGRLDLEDAARKHIPELPDYGQRLTVAHMMHNTAGVRDMLELMRFGGTDLGQPCRREHLLEAIFRQRGLNFAPGSRYLYSNANFLLLGVIVERITGKKLPDFLERRIFAPVGMNATRMTESTSEVAPGLATGYMPEDGVWKKAAHGFPLGGEGGLVSCVADLAVWDRALATNQLGLTEALERQAPFNNGRPNHYARGLSVGSFRGLRTVEHGGQWPGFRTEFLRAPAAGLTVICISNDGSADPYHVALDVLDAALSGRPGLLARAAAPLAAEFSRLTGRWLDRDTGETVELFVGEAGPMARTHGFAFRLLTTEDGRFAASRAARDFTVALARDETLELEADAGVTARLHRVAPGAALPSDLDGSYENPDTAARWTIAGGGLTVDGPLLRGVRWTLEPIAGDFIRINQPGTLYKPWFDVRVLRDRDGAVAGLAVNGNRVRHVNFARVA